MYYLLKTEPSEYSFEDLAKDGTTVWDGVTNPQAVKNLREMKKGDHLVIYHTGNEKQTAGTASVVSIDSDDPKTPKVTIRAGKKQTRSHTLAELKQEKIFADSPLVKQGRLSVVPLTEDQWKFLAA